MSPELIDPQRFGLEESRRTKHSDYYALGMVIYETVSGHFPFHRHTDYTVIVKVLAGEHPPRGVGFGESVWKMLELCWATQPDDRPSAKDVLQCLEGLSNLLEPPLPRADKEIEVDSYRRDPLDGSYGMFPPSTPLQRFPVSECSRDMAIDTLMTKDVDSHTSSSHAPSAFSEWTYSTDSPDATKQNDDPGLSFNNNFASGTHPPQISPYPPYPPYPSPLPPPRPPPQTEFWRVRDASEPHPITTSPQTGRRMDGNGIYLNVRALASTFLAFAAVLGLSI